MNTTLMPEADFRTALVEHQDALYRLGLKLSRQPSRADDLVQETFLKALRSRFQFRYGTRLRPWLFTILRNSYINHYRRERRAPVAVEFSDIETYVAAAAPTGLPAEVGGDHERDSGLGALGERLDQSVKRAVEDLPDAFRQVFLLASVEELSYKEISTRLGIPAGTVMSRLFRARKLLQNALADYAEEQPWLASALELADEVVQEPVAPALAG